MVSVSSVKKFKKGGKAIAEQTSLVKKYGRKSAKVGGKGFEKTSEIAVKSLKTVKSKSKKINNLQKAALLAAGAAAAYSSVNVANGFADYNKRVDKKFTVTEVFYKDGDSVNEISFVITNPEKIEIFPDDSFVITEKSSFYDKKFSDNKLKLDVQPYMVTETKISKDKENEEQPNLNPDIPYVVTIMINTLDLSGSDKDMIKTGDKLFVIQLKPDVNNDIKDEFEDDAEEAEKAIKAALEATTDWFGDLLKNLGGPIVSAIIAILAIIIVMIIIFGLVKLLKKKKP